MSALTDTQKSQIRRWLGVPDVSRQYDLRLESSLDALSVSGCDLVVSILTELESIAAQLKEARECRLKVGAVEDIEIRGPEEIRTLWREGNRLAVDLGAVLYFHPRRRPFGTNPPDWVGGGGPSYVMHRG